MDPQKSKYVNPFDFIFLLGGHDLEMAEIKNILKVKGLTFYDNNLSWGARLSSYKDVFNDRDIFVGIELTEDGPRPKNYICIDHHNKNIDKLPSLKQVADLLSINLSRYQLLICANDSGYIPAMEAMGASPEKIKEIREKDKFEQGVTAFDEELASQSIVSHSNMFIDILCVNSLTLHFSTITDILYPYNKLLISYQDHFVYYGIGVDKLVLHFQNFIVKKVAFHGGGNNGFFGIVKGKLSYKEVESIKSEIMELVKKPKISSHIFLFPFSYYNPFETAIRAVNTNDNWRIDNFKIDNVHRFNQHVYFHDFAEKILMPTDQKEVGCWEYKNLGTDAHYYIQIKGVERPFDLTLSRITLYLLNSQIGVLSFYMDNYNTENPEDILKINEYGRRLYPQFLAGNDNLIEASQYNFLPLSITLSSKSLDDVFFTTVKSQGASKEGGVITFDDFSYYKHFEYIEGNQDIKKEKRIKLPGHIINILGSKCFSDSDDKNSNAIFIKPLIDDRMFIMCCFQNSSVIEKLQKFEDAHYKYELFNNKEWIELSSQECKNWSDSIKYPFSEEMKIQRKELDFWYRYVFIDKDEPTSQSIHQITDLINKHTYDRWINWGTLYGVSRYSFVIITGSQVEFESKLDNHFKNLYYFLVLSSLIERTSILRFSEKVSSIASTNNKMKLNQSEIEKVTKLYYDYINFINNFHLREITAQEQGIELYNLLLEKMNIKNEVEYIDNEIAELHTYVNMVEDRERNRKMANLNLLATFFLPATLLAAIFGIGFITNQTPFLWFTAMDPNVLNAIIVIAIFGFAGIIAFNGKSLFYWTYRKIIIHK